MKRCDFGRHSWQTPFFHKLHHKTEHRKKYRKRASNISLKLFNLVRMGGLEPPRPCEH